MTELRDPFLGHTVMATEVATVCDGNTQIIDSSVVEI
jgi:hypothetical protein